MESVRSFTIKTKEKINNLLDSKLFYTVVGFVLGRLVDPMSLLKEISLGWWFMIMVLSSLLGYALFVRYKLNQDLE